ncbi:ERCC4 domain-containing protein [Fusarium sp. LHS14.1]|nr:ERCC4 domain-containing protein [Fusarium sp. LHS14.1]
MAPEVIDLISSSPSNPPPSQPRPAAATVRQDELRNAQQVEDVPNTHASILQEEPLFFSDDFDTTIDLDEPIIADTTGSKKRRLSPAQPCRPLKRTSPGLEPQTILPPVRNIGGGRTYTIPDPIEVTSSPEHHQSPRRRPPIPAPTKSARTTTELEDDDDPFASSPRPVHLAPPKPATRPFESSDPFASSSQPLPNTSKAANPIAPSPIRTAAPVSKSIHRRTATWDPISSSAPEVCSFDSSPPGNQGHVVIDIDDSDANDDSEDDLPDISSFDITKIRRRSQLQRSQSDVIPSKSRSRSKPTTTATRKKSAADKAREKEARAAAKEVDKETKRREKQEAKEAKAREKERNAALAEVNKLRTDKKVSTPEVMVDIPSSLNPTVTTQLTAMLEPLDVQFTTWESPVENVIKWRRKVKSRYNDDLGLWEPIPLRLQDEKHALVVMAADEFVKLALDDELSSHVEKMARHFSTHHILYLLEGLIPWMRKNRNLRNRQFTSRVRAQEASASNSSRRNKPAESYIPEETIEDALLQLQVMHDVLIHHTTIPLETAEWIVNFTQHVSTIPYRKQRDQATLVAGFCMESGQVKTGENTKDTYVKMLQEIVRVTAPIAYGVAQEFTSVSELVRGLEAGGPTRLEGVRKSANKDGTFSDRTIGQAVSRRMYKVFTGQDETSTDV